MYSHYSAVAGLPVSMSMVLDSAFDAIEENFWDDEDLVKRPLVLGASEQALDLDDEPVQEDTPVRNTSDKKAAARRKKPAKKR